eukprot:19673_1
MSIQQANEGLKAYYKRKGVNDYNNYFLKWCEDLGMDDEAVREEFSENPNESILVDFNEYFPLQNINNDIFFERENKIMNIIKLCFYGEDPEIRNKLDKLYQIFNDSNAHYLFYRDPIRDAGMSFNSIAILNNYTSKYGNNELEKLITVSLESRLPFAQFIVDLYFQVAYEYNISICQFMETSSVLSQMNSDSKLWISIRTHISRYLKYIRLPIDHRIIGYNDDDESDDDDDDDEKTDNVLSTRYEMSDILYYISVIHQYAYVLKNVCQIDVMFVPQSKGEEFQEIGQKYEKTNKASVLNLRLMMAYFDRKLDSKTFHFRRCVVLVIKSGDITKDRIYIFEPLINNLLPELICNFTEFPWISNTKEENIAKYLKNFKNQPVLCLSLHRHFMHSTILERLYLSYGAYGCRAFKSNLKYLLKPFCSENNDPIVNWSDEIKRNEFKDDEYKSFINRFFPDFKKVAAQFNYKVNQNNQNESQNDDIIELRNVHFNDTENDDTDYNQRSRHRQRRRQVLRTRRQQEIQTAGYNDESENQMDIYEDVQVRLKMLLQNDTWGEYKSPTDLLTEYSSCMSNVDICTNCKSIKRIIVILTAYKKMLQFGLCENMSFATTFTFKDIYTLTEILGDFFHIKDHFDQNINVMQLHKTFREQLESKPLNKYRRFRISRNVNTESMDDVDVDFIQTFDKIHSYVIGYEDLDPSNQQTDHHEKEQESIYQELVKNVGVFCWQRCHGFGNKEYSGTMHLKPKYNNIKEECLQNRHHSLNKDEWNRILRKSKLLFRIKSIKDKMFTQYPGYYVDNITNYTEHWKRDIHVDMKEIVILKLYTDYDELQAALKQCFRYQTKARAQMTAVEITLQNEKLELLKHKLESFYHWRIRLLITLHKFGTKLQNRKNMVFYHGVNKTMLIKTSETFAFSGPLSTSVSEEVARAFATTKGMVLKITSNFPHSHHCNAFDVSLISDYPEEQEWLVGFMYVRVLEITINIHIDNIALSENIFQQITLSSWIRHAFFAIHLFRSQIFSMGEYSARILSEFLKVNRYECCKKREQKKYQSERIYFEDWDMDFMVDMICKKYHLKQDVSPFCLEIFDNPNNKDDITKNEIIFDMIWNKLNEFRQKPNSHQCVKIDIVSDHLKRFFLKQTGLNIQNGRIKWSSVSFTEITYVYPHLKEIHLINEYVLDDILLKDLIQQITRTDKENTIKKVVFLYYNVESITTVFDEKEMNTELINRLEEEGWAIKWFETRCKIKISIYQIFCAQYEHNYQSTADSSKLICTQCPSIIEIK